MITTKQSLVCALALFLTVGTAFAQTNNTAFGQGALQNNTSGTDDSAFGFDALFSNTTGSLNTASGFNALFSNTTGYFNTASGGAALICNTTGYDNTASGVFALDYNTTGIDNTASGFQALLFNSTGNYNTASGVNALQNNTTGQNNTANGIAALQNNTNGSGNVGDGAEALFGNTTGFKNTAAGDSALYNNTSGQSNIAFGFKAGYHISSGSNNIEIGSMGAADANTIRLGTQGTQKATYIAGISGTPMTGADVVVSRSGRLGVLPSSARYKKDIQSLNNRSQGLWQLRPVSFRYKQDPEQRQYGLIAEQVAKVYPELVVRGDKGEIQSVQYRELIPLMLNEMQHQQAALTAIKAQNDVLRAALAQQNEVFAARLERLERMSAKTVASRRLTVHAHVMPARGCRRAFRARVRVKVGNQRIEPSLA
jgi:hypothetical protein